MEYTAESDDTDNFYHYFLVTVLKLSIRLTKQYNEKDLMGKLLKVFILKCHSI